MTALRSINRNRIRSLLTMLGIIIGVGSVIGLMAIGRGSEESIKKELGKIGTNLISISPLSDHRGGVSFDLTNVDALKESDIKEIELRCPTVHYLSPVIQTKSQVIYGTNNSRSTVIGAYRDYFKIHSYEARYGQLFDDKTGKSLQKVCVIGKTVAEDLFENPRDAVGAIIRLDKIPFRVIGVLEEKGPIFGIDRDDFTIAPFKTVQKRVMGINYVAQILAATESEDDVEKAKEELNDVLLNHLKKISGGEPVFEINTQKEMMEIMGNITGMLTLLLTAIASISLLVGGVGIMNIMLVTVTERTREIGLRLAVGAPAKAILFQFLTEAVTISLIGGIFGILLGYGIAQGTDSLVGLSTTITPASVLMAFGFAFAVGIIFGYFPARKAARLNPIQALRHE